MPDHAKSHHLQEDDFQSDEDDKGDSVDSGMVQVVWAVQHDENPRNNSENSEKDAHPELGCPRELISKIKMPCFW